MKESKRKVEVLVLSDIHLGTYGCHAKELLKYLKSIRPKKVILNGDIIDIWQFSKSYWPKSHMRVIKYLTSMIANGVKVYYVTGNHDEMFRKFVGLRLGSLTITNKVKMRLNGKTAWFFHGDVFDVVMEHSKWLAKLGAVGYDMLILLNRLVNFINEKLGRGPVSMSKQIKNGVKSAVAFINNFEQVAAEIAISKKYDYVVCGHIHQPVIKQIMTEQGAVTYLNSGDWIENLTALEYNEGEWQLYRYQDDELAQNTPGLDVHDRQLDNQHLFEQLQQEFKLLKRA